ncbi:GNAT family N-acetyltransferase [Pseudobdellovibrio sp. HCB154]|uniref:GNAT family N-acetyltransferase n=1 Tax=Pseudobdellovibrio sp. HCB154 TaxID=3386277 RepID=UPI003916D417
MSEIKIRQLNENDWPLYREIRMEALAKESECFTTSEDESEFISENWIERITNKNGAIFGLFDTGQIIGVTSIHRENDDPRSYRAWMGQSYIKAEYRGHHLSDLLFEARIAWAKKQGNIIALVVAHREENEVSKKAIQHYGFKYIGSRTKTYVDGEQAKSLVYERSL